MKNLSNSDCISLDGLNDQEAQISFLAAEVAELRNKISALHSLLQETIDCLDPVKSSPVWFYDARFPLDAANLHKAEYWDTYVKRWVGPEPSFCIVIALDSNQSYRVEIKIYDFITAAARATFILRVEGIEVPWKSIIDKTYRTIVIPPRSGLTTLHFSCAEAKSPRDLNPKSNDTRAISFSIGYIRIESEQTMPGDTKGDVAHR